MMTLWLCGIKRCSSCAILPASAWRSSPALRPEDLDFSEGTVRVTGKGGKTRIVPFGSKAADVLREWIKRREILVRPGETALFLSRYGKNISHRSIGQRLKIQALRQGYRGGRPPACTTAFICLARVAIQWRLAGRAGDAGACQYQHHAGLYPS